MKRYISIVFVLFFSLQLVAQNEENPCLVLQSMYDKKVKENSQLESTVIRLRKDSAQFTEKEAKLKNTAEQYLCLYNEEKIHNGNLSEHLENAKLMLSLCKKDSAKMQQQLKRCSPESIQRYEDSIAMLNKKILTLTDKIEHLSDLHAQNTKRLQEQRQEIAKLDAIVKYLDSRFSSKSVDELYHSCDMGELVRCVELYHYLGKSVPANILMVKSCFEAEQLVNIKYDPLRIKQYMTVLPQKTKIGKDIAQRLQDYSVVNANARQLWEQIHTEVCSKEIPNENFLQVQSKRQIWQRTQKFLNRYPTLATDYPYIFDQLQSMLRQIWDNANNFNAIPNPF